MTLDYWWSKRNNRRAVVMPDINAPFELSGTPETRLANCMMHARRNLIKTLKHDAHKRAWRAANR